jgi:hypothetical protein
VRSTNRPENDRRINLRNTPRATSSNLPQMPSTATKSGWTLTVQGRLVVPIAAIALILSVCNEWIGRIVFFFDPDDDLNVFIRVILHWFELLWMAIFLLLAGNVAVACAVFFVWTLRKGIRILWRFVMAFWRIVTFLPIYILRLLWRFACFSAGIFFILPKKEAIEDDDNK